MTQWTITMLDTGTQSQVKGFMTYLTDMDQPIQIPVPIALFPNARFFVQREELRYALAPTSFDASAYFAPSLGIIPDYLGTKFELLDGDAELADGVRAVTTPGHTPGHQSVLVDTAAGRYCIAGDAVMWYENLERQIPPGIHTSMIDCMASMARIVREADHVLPGHDPKVFARQPARYP